MKKNLFILIFACISVVLAHASTDYNKYVTCEAYSKSSITVGSKVQISVGFSITNSGKDGIYITKLVAKDPETKEILVTSTDTELLGQLNGGEEKNLSINLNKNVTPVFEVTYSVNNQEYVYDATQYIILSITSNKFGKLVYEEIEVGDKTQKFSLNSGDDAAITIVADEESELISLIVNSNDVTSSVVNNEYYISNITASTTVKAVFKSKSSEHPTFDGHEYVDLGLPSGSLWSTTNYESYSNNNSFSSWGSKWTMPTKDDFQELIDECDWTWTCINDVNGYSIRGKNGKTMFLPAAGKQSQSWISATGVGTMLYYMTSTENGVVYKWYFEADATSRSLKSAFITDKISVRPIAKEKNTTGISNNIIIDDQNAELYNLNGAKINKNQKGLIVVKSKNGKSKKIIVK